jgi:MFS family permease
VASPPPGGRADPVPLWTRPFVLCVCATTALFLALYLPLPVLPPHAAHLGASKTGIGVAIGIFSIAAMVVRLWTGPFLDRPGRKRLLLAGVVVFALAAFGYGAVPRFSGLLALRVVQGCGWGLAVTGVAAIVADLAPAARRGEAIGWWGLAPTLAMAVGPWAASELYAARGATPVFVAAAALGLGALAFLLPVPESLRKDAGRARPAFSLPRGARLPSAVLLLSSLSYGSVLAFLPVELADRPGRAGAFFSIYAAAILVSRPLAGVVSDRLGRLAVVHPGLALGAVGALLLGHAAHPLVLPLAALLYGVGIGGASFPGLMALAVDRCAPEERAAGLALFFAAYDVAIASGSALLGPVYERAGFAAMNAVAAACVVAAQAVLWRGLREGRPRA